MHLHIFSFVLGICHSKIYLIGMSDMIQGIYAVSRTYSTTSNWEYCQFHHLRSRLIYKGRRMSTLRRDRANGN